MKNKGLLSMQYRGELFKLMKKVDKLSKELEEVVEKINDLTKQ